MSAKLMVFWYAWPLLLDEKCLKHVVLRVAKSWHLPHMLSRAHRLTDNKEFQTIYRRGRYNSTALLSVNVLPNKFGTTKIGVVASKKAARKAHDRNAVKRKVREAVRLAYPSLKTGNNIIITIKAPATAADYKVIEKDLIGSLKKLGLINE